MGNDSADPTVPPSGRFVLQPVCDAVHHATYKQFQYINLKCLCEIRPAAVKLWHEHKLPPLTVPVEFVYSNNTLYKESCREQK